MGESPFWSTSARCSQRTGSSPPSPELLLPAGPPQHLLINTTRQSITLQAQVAHNVNYFMIIKSCQDPHDKAAQNSSKETHIKSCPFPKCSKTTVKILDPTLASQTNKRTTNTTHLWLHLWELRASRTEWRTADAVHGDGDRLVRLTRDGAQRHPARAEALHDLRGRLHLVQGHRLAGGDQLQAVAQHALGAGLEMLLVCLVRRLRVQG